MKIGCFQTNFTIDEMEMVLIDAKLTYSPAQVYDVWDEFMVLARRNLRIVVSVNPSSPLYPHYIRNYCGFFDRTTVVYVQPLCEQTIQELTVCADTPILPDVIQLAKEKLNLEILPF